ncbi:uncharacterized protein EV154DRAFT_549049 [Mucor mucedo]|uniref:uncharacterized protein n=1 Tax=Mucor mucedo TaxID=29922 RepID=UPI002220912F|nr:uncharacterized protein EV154DRAFT_549049 [Mucor mucedo]KAI7894647.1 hypothetical protein EV154DRAFT_549049 [Mucor mucedo]
MVRLVQPHLEKSVLVSLKGHDYGSQEMLRVPSCFKAKERLTLVKTNIQQYDESKDAKTNIVNKFKAEYEAKFPLSKRCPSLIFIFDFDTLWFSTQITKTLTNERNKVSIALIKASGAAITKELQAENSNNGKHILYEEDSDSDFSNGKSDDENEAEFINSILVDEGAPTCLKEFDSFQLMLTKSRAYPGINMNDLYNQMLDIYKCGASIEKVTFDALSELFRGIGDISDRDLVKIKLFKIYEEAKKEDRYARLNKLPDEEIIDYTVEELNRKVVKTLSTRPDAGCAVIHERRIEKLTCFTEVKSEYKKKKKDTVSTHQDLLRLALFGVNEIEDINAECVLLIQIVGTVITNYGCIKHKNGPKIVFDVSKIKIPSSMQNLTGFIMQLDDLKKTQ